jgi:hypothetical protein
MNAIAVTDEVRWGATRYGGVPLDWGGHNARWGVAEDGPRGEAEWVRIVRWRRPLWMGGSMEAAATNESGKMLCRSWQGQRPVV